MNLIAGLVKEGLVTNEQVEDARQKQAGAKRPIQELLVEMGFVKEEDVIKTASEVFKMPVADLDKERTEPEAVKKVPYEKARRYGVCPLRIEGGSLVLAMSDPQDMIAIDDISFITGLPVKRVLSPKSQISELVARLYQSDDVLYDLLKNIVDDTKVGLARESETVGHAVGIDELKEGGSPIVKLINLILSDAIKSRASDIHVEPQEDLVEVRYRIDGDLKNIMKVPKKMQARLVARIKIMADLDIAEIRKPQDGRTRITANGVKTDLRISIIPAFHGEKVVLRLLGTGKAGLKLEQIGFPPKELQIYKEAIVRPQGMILVTGPTGSGKTSTLYATLNQIKSEKKNIITIEDPIEYLIDGLNQIQTNPFKDVTFATGLRSILRQDPNVILVGEIRDRETADIAFRSSQTGHLVFSTLHTNNAIATITRLMDIGLEPYLIASSLIIIIAQRLVRVICPHCKEEYVPDAKLLAGFAGLAGGREIRKAYKGKGCEKCAFTGYFDRVAIIELLNITDKIRELITRKASEGEILEEAKKDGFRSLAEAGMEKVIMGITTLEEVAKVAGAAKEAPLAEASPAPGPAAVSGATKILVADDEEDILKVIGMRLKSAGYEVIMARNGKEAVEFAFRDKPDLIVMDVMMPILSGFDATKMLRSRLETATVPILMLTARKDKEGELEGLDAGADDYMTKPFDKDKLLARIKMLLRREAQKSGTGK